MFFNAQGDRSVFAGWRFLAMTGTVKNPRLTVTSTALGGPPLNQQTNELFFELMNRVTSKETSPCPSSKGEPANGTGVTSTGLADRTSTDSVTKGLNQSTNEPGNEQTIERANGLFPDLPVNNCHRLGTSAFGVHSATVLFPHFWSPSLRKTKELCSMVTSTVLGDRTSTALGDQGVEPANKRTNERENQPASEEQTTCLSTIPPPLPFQRRSS